MLQYRDVSGVMGCRRGSYFAPLSVEVGTDGFPELSVSQDLRDE